MSNRRCSNCGLDNRSDSNFCVSCGRPLLNPEKEGIQNAPPNLSGARPGNRGTGNPDESRIHSGSSFDMSRAATKRFAASMSRLPDIDFDTRGRDARIKGKLGASRLTEGRTDMGGDSIGTARKEMDGTIILQLRAETADGSLGDATFLYPPDHPDYNKILQHLGGLEKGQEKPVSPWRGLR